MSGRSVDRSQTYPVERGATSSRRILEVCSDVSPERIAAWTLAPYAMASSALFDFLQFLPVEEVADELHDTWGTSRAANEDDLVHLGFVDLGVAEDLLDGLKGGAEEILAQLFETCTGERSVEVDTLEERLDFDRGLGGRTKTRSQAVRRRRRARALEEKSARKHSQYQTHSISNLRRLTLLVLALELLYEVVYNPVIVSPRFPNACHRPSPSPRRYPLRSSGARHRTFLQ